MFLFLNETCVNNEKSAFALLNVKAQFAKVSTMATQRLFAAKNKHSSHSAAQAIGHENWKIAWKSTNRRVYARAAYRASSFIPISMSCDVTIHTHKQITFAVCDVTSRCRYAIMWWLRFYSSIETLCAPWFLFSFLIESSSTEFK